MSRTVDYVVLLTQKKYVQMKYWLIVGLVALVTFSCSSEEATEQQDNLLPATEIKNPNSLEGTEDAKGYPAISFDKSRHDFGTIEQGQVVRYDFSFTNTGDGSLIITNVKASCGCTVADYPKEPIAPGAGGVIPVEFNSRGRSNTFNKTVTVFANTSPNTTQLTIEGFIESK